VQTVGRQRQSKGMCALVSSSCKHEITTIQNGRESGADFLIRISASTAGQEERQFLRNDPNKKPLAAVKPIAPSSSGKETSKARRPSQRKPKDRAKQAQPAPLVIPMRNDSDPRREAIDRRRAVLRALEVIASSSRVLDPKHGAAKRVGVE
jgi:hypothetical protein